MRDSVTVLHVDDEPELAALTGEFLAREDEAIEVTTAASVEEGLEAFANGDFDCIVSDYEMPGRDGIEFLQAVRAEAPELPFILYTGRGSEDIASEAISAGVTDYLQKESGTGQYTVLANRITNAVEQHRARERLAENEKRLGLFFDESPMGIIEWDDEFAVERINARGEAILGYEPGALDGASWESLVPDDELEDVETVMNQMASDPDGSRHINDVLRADGERITCEWHNRIITDEDGALVASFAKFHDITERVERERKLTELRDRAQDLMYTASRLETAQAATEAADEIIGAPLSGVHLLTEEGDALEATALSPGAVEVFDLPLRYPRGEPPGSRAAVIWDVFENEIPKFIDDTSSYDALDEHTPAGSVFLHPLPGHGIFVISAEAPNSFDETDRVLVEVLSSFLTTALDRLDREARLRDRERRLERLHAATQDIMEAETQEAVLETAVGAAEDILDFRLVIARLFDDEEGALVPVAESGAVDDLVSPRIPYDGSKGSLNWRVFQSGEHQVFHNLDDIERALAADTDLQSLLVFPLGEYGTLAAAETRTAAFDDADIFLARILAIATETALDRTDREGEIRRHLDVLERREGVLREMHDIIAAHDRSFTEQVTALLELGRRELETGYGTLSRIDGDEYHFEIVSGVDDAVEAGDVVPTAATNCELAVAQEETIVLGDVARDAPDETHREGFSEWGITCYIGAPVYSGESVYGSFCFYDTETRDGQFSEWERTLVDLMSRWVSTELQRQQAHDRLRTQNETLERFSSMVSHDLRNPLNVLAGRLDLAEETGDPEEFERCRTAIDRMESLIDSLLQLAQDGEMIDRQEPVDLAALCEDCWETVSTADAEIVIESERVVVADPSRLQQLLENLFSNAIEHGGDDVTVTVRDMPGGFVVEDTGPGIPAADRELVFDQGFSTSGNGIGFGLMIVEEVADAHGWSVSASEGDAGGARFEFTDVETQP